ncbi:MAG: FtsX-like permease family protein [Erysipelotrichaceae bacterium]|nr:FtsX-like permease family protein [Erysipelotrichaceae bacterium]
MLSDILFNINHNVELLGENSSDTIALRYKNSRVTEGRSFTDEEIKEGRFVCMVPKGFTVYSPGTDTKIKDAEIGDIVYCRSSFFKEGQYAGGKIYRFEIIGIIQNENSEDDSQFRVVVPNQCILKIRNDDLYYSELYDSEIMGAEWADMAPSQYDFSNYDRMLYFTLTAEKMIEMSRVRIELNHPRDIEKFNDYYHSHLSDYPTLKVSVSTADFDRIAGPVRNLRNLSQIVCIVVTLVSLLVTGLLVLLSIKNRFREMGLYLALGERKCKVVLDLVTEYVIIGFLALTISMFIGNRIAEKGAEAVISQYDFPAEQIESEFTTATTEDVINAFDVKLDSDSALMLTACTMGIVLIASSFASLYVVRIKPREVLLK